MLGEGAHLGIELGIEPVGLRHGRLEVVQDQAAGHAAEVAEGVLEAAEEVVGGLAGDGLAEPLAGVAQDDAEDVGLASLAVGADKRAPVPKSTWASSPGSHSMRRKGSSWACSRRRTNRRTA